MMHRTTPGAILLCLLALQAFSPPSQAGQEPITLTLATGQPELFEASVARYMAANPDVTVRILSTPGAPTGQLALYQQALNAHSPDVDLYDIEITWPSLLARHLADLRPFLDDGAVDRYFPALIGESTIEGRLVALPYIVDAGVLYSRADLLEKYGYAAPPATWDALEAMAQAIQQGEREAGNAGFWGFLWQGERYEGLTCNALEWQYAEGGGRILDDAGRPQVNNTATLAALERAAAWPGFISPPAVTALVEEDTRLLWRAGYAAFMRHWTYVARNETTFDFTVSPLPAGDSGQSGGCLRGWALAVSSYSRRPVQAAALAVFLAGEEEQRRRALDSDANPTLAALYDDADMLSAAPWLADLKAVFTGAVPRPAKVAGAAYDQVSGAYAAAVHQALTGEVDPADALEDLERELAALLPTPTSAPERPEPVGTPE